MNKEPNHPLRRTARLRACFMPSVRTVRSLIQTISLAVVMRKSVPFEIVGAVSAMLGAVLLVFTYYPVINPIRYRIDNHHEPAPVSRYILGTPVSLLILSGAWYFNRKAQKLKRDEKDSKHV